MLVQIMFSCVMHIDTIPNRSSRPAYLLRESVREGKRVTKRTIANLSSLPVEQMPALSDVSGHTVEPDRPEVSDSAVDRWRHAAASCGSRAG